MPLTKEILMAPRYKAIADYPSKQIYYWGNNRTKRWGIYGYTL